ncbi:MAG TPA: hypothetical protein VNU19_13600 [Candidatus Acidoferrum sp.]|nr:hypothetical protein [Candidatus Acidoferrum sp.]
MTQRIDRLKRVDNLDALAEVTHAGVFTYLVWLGRLAGGLQFHPDPRPSG